ncbi:MAG: SsrA-binding protein SmpB [Rhodospirillales bacterium]|nr:SsrA-binding protein SmpB [Alphaproteobacteria bacterium]MBL6947790.1 SsrA-binding protein SmpB [Rhodospirillales bacterium]
MAAKKKRSSGNTVAQNRKARRDYAILEIFEAGIMLLGTEVKSLRSGRASIGEAYAQERNGELYLNNAFIPAYESAGYATHNPREPRKLLLHKREIAKLLAAINRKGMTLVPLSIYFNERGIAKVQLALGEGKQKRDKRQDEKSRDWQRDKARLMRDKG